MKEKTKSNNDIEILAPAGSQSQLDAAIAAGANAVYLGMQSFSARAGAKNFSEEELEAAILRCHKAGVRVYVAINTLIKDSEIEEAISLIDRIYMMGTDALIIQDFGILKIVKDRYQGMEIHASTQMSIHNEDGCLFAKENGIKRVILARELPLDEIRAMSSLGIDTEIFIHGAICISYSGQCQFSINKGPRSANRGSCAQPCRQPYSLYENGKFIKKGHLISPKERSLLSRIDEVKKAGVSSLKIEGRLRNQYYVYEVIRQYSNALQGKSKSLDRIAQIFNRDGFTDSYIDGSANLNMITTESGSNSGIYLGKIKNGEIDLKQDISTGDGVVIKGGKGFIVTKISELKNGRYVLFPRRYKDGDLVFKTSDARQKKEIETSIKEVLNLEKEQNISVPVRVFFTPEKPIQISGIENGGFSVFGDTVQFAKKAPISREKIRKQLEKKSPEGVRLKANIVEFEDGFLPISSINQVRRDWIEEYINKVIRWGGRERELPEKYEQRPSVKNPRDTDWNRLVVLSTKDQLRAYFKVNPAKTTLCLNPYFKDKGSIGKSDITDLDDKGIPYYIQTREVIRREMDEVVNDLLKLKNISGILSGNLGLINKIGSKLKLIGDVGLNVYNSIAPSLFPNVEFFIPSPELPEEDLLKLKNKEVFIPLVYSKAKLMHMEYCPNRKGDPCSKPCRKNDYNLDEYKLIHDEFCRVSILNSEASTIKDKETLKKSGFNKSAIVLTDESYEETVKVLSS